ncbi:MAG TPA: Rne/Rng family ribonuclease [Bryobacteraceae bacterium]|nr:Rne/Rng family ribonuclease [Bryobacteraceae bacterium]
MSKELVICSNRHDTKVAILEDDQLVEVYFQSADEYSLAGSIHKGRVTRVLPGMQSAFVDLGLERDTFLYVSDFFEESEEYDRLGGEREGRPERQTRPERDRPERERPVERFVEPPAASVPSPYAGVEAAAPIVEPAASPLGETRSAEPRSEPVHRGEDAEGRGDQRGRRSRRRRNRGRGFPDSKYAGPEDQRAASAVELATASPASVSPGPLLQPLSYEEPLVSSGPAEFSVLPGESLAKYARAHIAPLDEQEEEEIRTAQQEFEAQHGGIPELAQPERELPPASEPVMVEAAGAHADEAHREPVLMPASATAAAPALEPPLPILMEAFLPEPRTKPPAGSELVLQNAIAEEVVESVESPEETPEEVSHEVSEDISDQANGLPRVELLAEIEEPEPAEHTEAAGEVGVIPDSEPKTANVRDQSGRYPHRLPRRMRRKMRGPERGGDRSQEGRPALEALPAMGTPETVLVSPQPRLVEQRSVEQRTPAPRPVSSNPLITDLLKEGQEIIVQIAKEPLGQKGARITSHIALPGRYVVYMPTLEHMGVSRKVANDDERLRLKKILQTHRAGIPGGFILRTAGEGKSEEDIAADISFLYNLWTDIRSKAEKKPAPLLLHHDLDIVQRTLRDQLTDTFKAIWVDNEEVYESTLRFVQRFQPALVSRVKLYTRPAPIFDAFNITAELEKALRPKVWLKSGGYIVINQTEALVAIDVNTGKYVGKSNRLEDTIVKTNTEAVKEIVRQVRLRDLGGIIVVDFIDMDERKNRQKVMQALEDAMQADRAPNKILQFNDFGLVAITRKRVKQSLERTLCSPCPYCEGAGYVKSVSTVIGEILQEAHKLAPAVGDQKDVMLRVHPEVAKVIKSHHNHFLEELEEILRRPVLVKTDPTIHQEKYDLA